MPDDVESERIQQLISQVLMMLELYPILCGCKKQLNHFF